MNSGPDDNYNWQTGVRDILKKNINIKNLDYKALFERYLIQLREIMKGA